MQTARTLEQPAALFLLLSMVPPVPCKGGALSASNRSIKRLSRTQGCPQLLQATGVSWQRALDLHLHAQAQCGAITDDRKH